MITTLNMDGGWIGRPEGGSQKSNVGRLAKMIKGDRTGEIVRIVAESGGFTTALWKDQKETNHKFSAPSTIFEMLPRGKP